MPILPAIRVPWRRVLIAASVVLALVLLWGLVVVARLPEVASLASGQPRTTAFIDRYIQRCGEEGREPELRWRWVDYDLVSPNLKRAVLVAEDINFFSHEGFDRHEISQALKVAVQERDFPRGASTLTQQLARNLFLSPARTPWRKLEEALLTRRLEAALTKRRILEIYLNVVEFGPGIYGAEAASRHYFGVGAFALTTRQAAELAAVLPRPSTWHPGRQTEGYLAAVERIERRMERADFLWKRI